MVVQIESSAFSHVGQRAHNEDSLCLEPKLGLFAVADGMGGYEGGEVASAIAIETVTAFFRRHSDVAPLEPRMSVAESMISLAVRMAHEQVCVRKVGRYRSMGTTLATLLLRDGQATMGHVGDSRIYRLRQGVLELLTRDHSLARELEAAGVELSEQLSHVITRALGQRQTPLPDLRRETLLPGDLYLLCTDGLSEVLTAAQIAELIQVTPLAEAGRRLVEEAIAAGGSDNSTALLVKVTAL